MSDNCKCGGDCVCGKTIELDFTGMVKSPYKYREDDVVTELMDRIRKTYSAHYATDDIQTFDIWLALGNSADTFRNNALKYLWRYGKKSGRNVEDLYKAMHFIALCIYADNYYEQDR